MLILFLSTVLLCGNKSALLERPNHVSFQFHFFFFKWGAQLDLTSHEATNILPISSHWGRALTYPGSDKTPASLFIYASQLVFKCYCRLIQAKAPWCWRYFWLMMFTNIYIQKPFILRAKCFFSFQMLIIIMKVAPKWTRMPGYIQSADIFPPSTDSDSWLCR